jgi:hypothetical protein
MSSRGWRWRGWKQTLCNHGIVRGNVYKAAARNRRKGPKALGGDVVVVDPTFSPSPAAIADRDLRLDADRVAYAPCICATNLHTNTTLSGH